MPLPHFLFLLAATILAAALTLWISLTAGVPLLAFGLLALSAVALLQLSRDRHDNDG